MADSVDLLTKAIDSLDAASSEISVRILSMAERQLAADIRTAYIGQFFAFVVAMSFLVASVYLIGPANQPVAGGVLGTVDLVSLVTVFLLGKRSDRSNSTDEAPPKTTASKD